MLANDIAESIPLDGEWQFTLNDGSTWETIQVPGCWEAQGYPKGSYGPARYRRAAAIPAAWAGKCIRLAFDAVSYACTVYCNGSLCGEHLGMWTPFAIDISAAARPGEDNLFEVVVEKPGGRYPTRSSLAGFLPDVATTFGGLWQPVRLEASSAAIADAQILADYDTRSIQVRARAETTPGGLNHPAWKLTITQSERMVLESLIAWTAGGALDAAVAIPGALAWSPDDPQLYTACLTLLDGNQPVASVARRTGFRKLSADGDQLLFNDRPFMVRGILSWGWLPEKIAPVYTLEEARAELRKARAMGFNLVKLCLVIPTPAYFAAADEEGMLLWEELPMWLPEVNEQVREVAPVEYRAIAAELAHHPSVAIYSLGCELNESVDAELMGSLNRAVRGTVRDGLVCDNSGSGESYGGLDFDFSDFTDYHPYYDLHYFEPLLDNWRRDWQPPRPWIFGEFCDSDTFRDLNEIIFDNGGTRPWWLTRDNPVTAWRPESRAMLEWETRLEAAQPGFSLAEMTRVSYQQSYTIRKYTLEALRRRRGIGGYIITGLRDTPISTSGVWDDFGRPKWSAEAFQQINGEAVLALDVVRRRQWRNGGDRPDRVDPHNWWAGDSARWYVILNDSGAGFPAGSRLDWSLTTSGESGGRPESLASGSVTLEHAAAPGGPVQVGSIALSLPDVEQAAELRLDVRLSDGGHQVTNRWPVWVYPRPGGLPAGIAVVDPSGLLGDFGAWLKDAPHLASRQVDGSHPMLVATELDAALWDYLESGGRVLLLQQGDQPLPALRCPFWREAIKLFADHPIWQRFPHNGFSGLNFFGLASDLAFDTSRLAGALPKGATLRPILRRLDAREFKISEYLFEARVGLGLLLGCTLRLQGGAGAQPTGWQKNVAGGAMLHALLNCLVSDAGRDWGTP